MGSDSPENNTPPMIAKEMLESIRLEATVADEKYGPYTSTHEAYGVLAEEMAELLDAIRANDLREVRTEARQVAAVAYRLAVCCEESVAGTSQVFRERSGG